MEQRKDEEQKKAPEVGAQEQSKNMIVKNQIAILSNLQDEAIRNHHVADAVEIAKAIKEYLQMDTFCY